MPKPVEEIVERSRYRAKCSERERDSRFLEGRQLGIEVYHKFSENEYKKPKIFHAGKRGIHSN